MKIFGAKIYIVSALIIVAIIAVAAFILRPSSLNPRIERPGIESLDGYYTPIDAYPVDGVGYIVLYEINQLSRIVVLNEGGNFLREFDPGFYFAHSLNPAGDGNFIVTDHGNDRLALIDINGNVLKILTGNSGEGTPRNYNSAIITPKNTILTSVRDWGLQELDWDGNILWSFRPDDPKAISGFETTGIAHDATLLKNGNVLYCSTFSGEVVEIDRSKNVVWRYKDKKDRLPKNARRLSNGNTLITHSNGISEVNHSGEVIRENTNYNTCYNFKILKNGDIMLSHSIKGLVFFDSSLTVKNTIKYKAPESWEAWQKSMTSEQAEKLKTLGYL